jgi:hypothetical protein
VAEPSKFGVAELSKFGVAEWLSHPNLDSRKWLQPKRRVIDSMTQHTKVTVTCHFRQVTVIKSVVLTTIQVL